jgi:hypothetical protein
VKRLRDQSLAGPGRALGRDPGNQEELGNASIVLTDKRAACDAPLEVNALAIAGTFATTLGKTATVGEPRAMLRATCRPYKPKVHMPSKLDANIAVIEGWLAEPPQVTPLLALAGGLSEQYPDECGTRQLSIVQCR